MGYFIYHIRTYISCDRFVIKNSAAVIYQFLKKEKNERCYVINMTSIDIQLD